VKKGIPLHDFGFHVHFRRDRIVKEKAIFAMSARLSSCISVTSTGQTFVKSYPGRFTKICRKIPNLVKVGKKYPTLYMNTSGVAKNT